MNKSNSLQQYLDLYDAYREAICSHSAEPLNALREAAREALEHAVLPRKGSEDYEATDLNEAFAPDYGVNINRVNFTGDGAESFRCDVPNMSTCLYYVYNDILAAAPTARNNVPEGVVITSLCEAAKHRPELLTQYYGKQAALTKPEVALNTLLAQDGVFIYVPDGTVMEKTIQLVNIFNATRPIMSVRRMLIIVGKQAQARILVCDHTQNLDVQYLSNEVVEIVADQGATVDFYALEESSPDTTRVSNVFVNQQADSNVLIDGITLLNGFTRNNFSIEVNGEHAETHLMGMAIAGQKQHVDNLTFIAHKAPRCTSNEMFKYVLNDHAVGAFAGKILVEPDCPRVEAYQGNRNLCASPEARMYTKPQLEIYTDDVKCSHGATVGRLDEDALFYLQTRGIGKEQARTLLMQAFMSDVIDGVRLEVLRDRLRHLVEKRFAGSLAACEGCKAACAVKK